MSYDDWKTESPEDERVRLGVDGDFPPEPEDDLEPEPPDTYDIYDPEIEGWVERRIIGRN